MSTALSQFFTSGNPITSSSPTGGADLSDMAVGNIITNISGLEYALSGTPGADTYESIVSVTGGGYVTFAGVRAVDNTARTMTIKVTIDGVAFEASTAATAATHGAVCVGSITGGAPGMEKIPFNISLDISIKQDLNETAKIEAVVKYWTV